MGYIGQSRSERSSEAIENFEIPLNHFDSYMIDDFKTSDLNGINVFNQDIFKFSVSIWKFVASEKVGASSWHHSGKYFNIVYHYDLYSIAMYLTENFKDIKKEYKDFKSQQKKRKKQRENNLKFAWIEFNIWGGTRSHPKIVDQDSVVGYIKETNTKTWLYAFDGSRHDVRANKIEKVKFFDNLKDLKKFLKSDIDLRHFKKFLRKHNKI